MGQPNRDGLSQEFVFVKLIKKKQLFNWAAQYDASHKWDGLTQIFVLNDCFALKL